MNAKLIQDICIISRHNVCLLDMKQVQEKAQELGLLSLAQLIETDLNENKITNGEYFPMVKSLYGA